MDILAQIIGIAAMFFSVFSFQANKHKQIMVMQIFATTLFGIQYFMLGAYTGMALELVATIRGMIFYHRDKKWAANNIWIVVFLVLFIAFGCLTWDGIKSLFVIIAMCLCTFTFSFTKPKLVRSTILICAPMMLVYSIITATWGGIINEVFVIISSIVGLIRYDLHKNVN